VSVAAEDLYKKIDKKERLHKEKAIEYRKTIPDSTCNHADCDNI
jgi:hypothetical protein